MSQDTYDLLEEAIQRQLVGVLNAEQGSEEEGKAVNRATALTELLISVDKESFDMQDKSERRRIEEERNKSTNEIELGKQKLTWGRVGFEMAKALAPIMLTMVGYDLFQKRILTFEETGRITSTAGRELHLPNFLKK